MVRKIFLPFVALALTLTMSSCASNDPAPTPPAQASVESLDRFLNDLTVKDSLPSLYFATSKPGFEKVVRVLGKRGDVPAAKEDFFRLGTVSESFTAAAIYQMASEGKLSLNDTFAHIYGTDKPVDPYQGGTELPEKLPYWVTLPKASSNTFATALSQHSGVADYFASPSSVLEKTSKDPSKEWSLDDLSNSGVKNGAAWPGTFMVSPSGYSMAAASASRVAGVPFNELVNGYVASKGLADLTVESSTKPPNFGPALADGSCVDMFKKYDAQVKPGTDLASWNPSSGGGSQYMVGTIDSLLTWGESKLGAASIEDPVLRNARVSSLVDAGSYRYGSGMQTRGLWVGYTGVGLGWSTMVFYNTQTQVSVAAATAKCDAETSFNRILTFLNTENPVF